MVSWFNPHLSLTTKSSKIKWNYEPITFFLFLSNFDNNINMFKNIIQKKKEQAINKRKLIENIDDAFKGEPHIMYMILAKYSLIYWYLIYRRGL